MYKYIGSETKENITGENYTMCIFILIKPKCIRWEGHAARTEQMDTANEIMAANLFCGRYYLGDLSVDLA
jgi:hypothetical protein